MSVPRLASAYTFIACVFAALTIIASTARASDVDIPYEKFQLSNGLTVIVHEDRKAPIVAVSVWYKVGSKDEPEGQTGFAHLFEHLMFNGSENYDDEWFKPLQEVGATGLNGTTNADRTNYFQTVPTPALDRILWMESDRMGHFVGAVTQEKLDEQRGVVQNEKRQGENQPYGRVFERIFKGLFPKGHPYAHTTIGSMEDLNAASLKDVKDWFKTYYGPSNAILVLAGDIDAEKARMLTEKYFGHIPPGPPLTKWDAWVPKRDANTRETMYDRVPQARIYRLWASPQNLDPTATDLFVAASVMGDGKNSRLYKSLVYDQQIATNVSVFNYELQMASIFGVIVDVKPGEDVAAAEAALDQQIAAFLKRGANKKEIALVAAKTRARTLRGLEQVGGFSGKAVTLAEGELIAGDPGYFQRELDELARATPASASKAARRWLRDGWHQITVLPHPDLNPAGPDPVDRSAGLPPVTGEASLSFPAIKEATLSNGMKVVLAERSAAPIVEMAVQFDAGYAADMSIKNGEAKPGLANFTAAMLDEGAGIYDALALSGELEALGALINADSSLDTTVVSLSALKENLAPSLDLLGDVVRYPSFDDEEIERQRKLILAGIAQEKASPVSTAIRLLPPLLYGDGHAYSAPLTGSGTEEIVTAINRDDLTAFHSTWLRPDNGAIYIAGDTTLEEILPMLEKVFGDWQPIGEKGVKNINDVALPNGQKAILIDRPDAPQSYILAGHIAPPTGHPDNIAITTMNDIIGGGFISRINLNLREDKGWSYGARTILLGAQAQRAFILLAPVQTDKTGAAIGELKKEFAAYLSARPAKQDELSRVKLDNVRSLPGRFETASSVLSSLLSSARYGRPYDFPTTLKASFEALSTKDVASAAKEVLHPDQLTWVIIGDAAKVKAEIEAAGIGPVEIRNADGK